MPARSVRAIRECDLPRYADGRSMRLADIVPDHEPGPDADVTTPYPTVRIGLTPTWGAAIVGYVPAVVCPGCRDLRLRDNEVCLVCHQTRRETRQRPMCDQQERAKLLAGPPPIALTRSAGRTRRERRRTSIRSSPPPLARFGTEST